LNTTNTAYTIFCVLSILPAANLSNLSIVLSNNSDAVTSFASTINNISNQSIDSNVIFVWSNLTTQLGIEEKLTPPEFSRVYALVHVSMYDSLLAAAAAVTEGKETWNYSFNNNDGKESSFYINSVAEAASGVLLYLFPNYANDITKLKSTQINEFANKNNNSLLLEKASMIGHGVSEAVINYAKTDNSDIVWNNNTILAVKNNTSCTWNGTNPVNPTAGFWKTYILTSGAEVQQQGPAPCGSEADLLDLRETYHIWKNKIPNQIKAIHYWGDKSPPVIWNNILSQHLQRYNKSIFDVAYANVYLNVGMYDAFVSCWYTKYDYWSARPFHRIANITTEIPTPNFPGYTSGHSVISMVASKVLGEIFPQEKNYFHNLAIEAGLSRLWAGIHFKQDVINGMDQGYNIANKIVGDMHKANHPFIYEY
jgi:hypothetical protein